MVREPLPNPLPKGSRVHARGFPSPSPSPTPPLYALSKENAGACDASGQGQGGGRNTTSTTDRALDVLARRDLAEAVAAGYRVADRVRFFNKKRADRAAVDGPTVRAVAAEHPDWDAESVAAYVEPRPPGATPYISEGTGRGVPMPADFRAQVDAARRAARAARRGTA